MTDRSFEPIPTERTIQDVVNAAFDRVFDRPQEFDFSTFTDALGLQHEQVIYQTSLGDNSNGVRVRATRPSIDSADILEMADGTIDEKPRAEAWVQAPRGFLFNLANGEKYFADKGFFRVVVLSDGTYLDILSIAFATDTNEYGDTRTFPDTVGSMLRPLPAETDWIIQDLIDPDKK